MGKNKILLNIHEMKFAKLAGFQANTNMFLANTNTSLKNLETQVGQLAMNMQNQSGILSLVILRRIPMTIWP